MKKKQCSARSKQSGQRCKRRPHPGTNVCVFHGAGSPKVKAKAQERLAERLAALAPPAISAMSELVKTKRPPAVRLRAAQDLLDRCGFGAVAKINVGGDSTMRENYTEPDFETLPAEDADRLQMLLGKFETGMLLTRAQQVELHALRKRAGQRKFLRISTPGVSVIIPDNGRD